MVNRLGLALLFVVACSPEPAPAPPLSAEHSSVGALLEGTVPADGAATVEIRVTVRDSAGAPLVGQTVVLAATGSGNTLTQPASPTDGDGVATGTLSSTQAEVKVVSASVGEVRLTQTASIEFVAVPPAVVPPSGLAYSTNPAGYTQGTAELYSN